MSVVNGANDSLETWKNLGTDGGTIEGVGPHRDHSKRKAYIDSNTMDLWQNRREVPTLPH
jgi:hypothetical protein